MRRALLCAFLCGCLALSGCGKEKSYAYDYSGVADAPIISVPDHPESGESGITESGTSSATVTEIKENIIKHIGFTARMPETWYNTSTDTASIKYTPEEYLNSDLPYNYVYIHVMPINGLDTMDTADILKSTVIALCGAERSKYGVTNVRSGYPCWQDSFENTVDNVKTQETVQIYLTDVQHFIYYKSCFETEAYNKYRNAINRIETTLSITGTQLAPLPEYTLRNGVGDLWSGIKEITYNGQTFNLKDKLSSILNENTQLYDDNDMVAPGEAMWMRITGVNSTIKVLVRNDTDIKRSAEDCKIYGIDAAYIFAGENMKWDDFNSETSLDMLVSIFGPPVSQDGSLAMWELDGQDMYVSFSPQTGLWNRVAITCLTDEETTQRQDAYVEAQANEQSSESWLYGGNK